MRWRAVVALSLFVFGGCSTVRREPEEARARRGGTFRLIVQNPPETLDPQRIVFLSDWELASLAYEGLTAYGAEPGEIRPALAESWEELDGGRRWIFKLRPNAYFHDDPCFPGGRGRKAVAGDVVYTLERVAHPKTACANWYLFAGKIEGIDDFHSGRAPGIRGVRVLDERRIEIRLTRPYAAFLKLLASQTALIASREAVEYYGSEFGDHPVGTGPFRLVKRTPLEQMLFARHANYWRSDARGVPLPYLDNIDVRIRGEATESVILAAFLKGETYLYPAQQNLYETLRADASMASKFRLAGVIPQAVLRFLGFSLDTGTPLAREARLRRAMLMAFDRTELARQSPQVPLYFADTLAPPFLLKRSRPAPPYDPEAARAVFAQYARELDANPPTLGVNFQSGDIGLLWRSLARLSVRSTIQIRPVKYYEYIVKERPSVFRVAFTPAFLDPEDYYCMFYSKSSDEVNLTKYRNAEYDRTLEAAMAEMNPARRTDRFLELEEMLSRDVPAIYLVHGTPSYVITSPRVHGLTVRFLHPNYTEAWVADPDETNQSPRAPASAPSGEP